MDQVIRVPLWKSAVLFTAYATLNGFIGLLILLVVAINLADYIPDGRSWFIGIMVASYLAAMPITSWCRYRVNNWEEIAAKRLARDAEMLARNAEIQRLAAEMGPSKLEEFLGTCLKLVLWICGLGAACVGIYIAGTAIASMPVTLAIIIGAVIIGLCILAASGR